MLVSLGKIEVVTAGSIVQCSATHINCNGMFIEVLPGNAGLMYVGLSTLVTSTLVGCLRILAKPASATSGPFDSWNPQSNVSAAPIDLYNIWFDASSSGDSVLVSYLVT